MPGDCYQGTCGRPGGECAIHPRSMTTKPFMIEKPVTPPTPEEIAAIRARKDDAYDGEHALKAVEDVEFLLAHVEAQGKENAEHVKTINHLNGESLSLETVNRDLREQRDALRTELAAAEDREKARTTCPDCKGVVDDGHAEVECSKVPKRAAVIARLREELKDLRRFNVHQSLLLENERTQRSAVSRRLTEERDEARGEAEQLRVQLAGCLVAAEGGTADAAKPGDYGYSLAYEKTLALAKDLANYRKFLARALAKADEHRRILRDLDRWLANTNHGEDHPWRVSIRKTVDCCQKCGAEKPKWNTVTHGLLCSYCAGMDADAERKCPAAHSGIECALGFGHAGKHRDWFAGEWEFRASCDGTMSCDCVTGVRAPDTNPTDPKERT